MNDKLLEDIERENIYRHLYENSPDMYRTINREGVIILCNKSYADKLGYTIGEVVGASILEHTAQQSMEDMQKTYKTWVATGEISNVKIWLKRKDGGEFPVLLNVNSLHDNDGRLIGSNTVMRDITEILDAKKEIEGLKLKRLSTLGELAARIAHDLRNPLTVIKSTLQVLNVINDPALEKYSSYFQRIDKAVMRISHQVDEVLDYVKPKPLNINPHSILDIIKSVVDKVGKNEEITINLPKNDIIIQCDEEKLEIVFVNLILNAIQAMNGRGTITIRIIPQQDVDIEIEDTGPGIPDKLKSKIFEPLFTTRQIGTGLGLPSCKTIVEKHHGKIFFASEIGKGTTFTISLPRMQPEPTDK
ncbi:MAG: PAS domain S-box protein [Thaumarchaeota archaeon]|nr:PAS domain S-box protein [Nitrososphaerota archaeon]